MLINVKMPTNVDILTFMSRITFVLSCVEHEKSFITSGPGLYSYITQHTDFQLEVFRPNFEKLTAHIALSLSIPPFVC